jgi:hypothetical protein
MIGGVNAAFAEEPAKHSTDMGSVIDLRNDYSKSGHTIENALVFRGDWAPRRWASIRVDVPFVYKRTRGEPVTVGLGDVLTRATVRLAASQVSLVVGTDLVLDSASPRALGAGKDRFGPFATLGYELGEGAWVRVAVQQTESFGGDPARPGDSVSSLRPHAFVALPEGFWLYVDQKLEIHHRGERKLAYTAVLEGGKELSDEVSIYIDPGVQIASPPAVVWMLTGGVHWSIK